MSKEYIEREALLYKIRWASSAEEAVMSVRRMPAADVIRVPNTGIGDVSDGYHTFNELYHHRAVLFSVICNLMPEKAWKSKYHDTGDMYDGMFIVGIETPEGQATYHYDIDPYWDMFRVKELERAPKWDGHTPSDAIERISTLSVTDLVEVVRCKDCKYYAAMVTDTVSGDMETATWGTCRQPWFNSYEYDVGEDGFCNCGARMDKEAE